MRKFGALIMRTVVFLVLFVLLVSIINKRDAFQSLMFAVALAVGLTPEFLPMITTITLGNGARAMADKGVIVKNLAAIQNFGSMDVLCTDKTGTLTKGEMVLERAVDVFGADSKSALQYAKVNSRLQGGLASALDSAILAAPGDELAATAVAEIPFDFDRRRLSVIAKIGAISTLVCKGAPEGVLSIATSYSDPSSQKEAPLDAAVIAKIKAVFEDLSRQGLRLLAVATKAVDDRTTFGLEDESGLCLQGFVAFGDPPLPDALAAIEALKQQGVRIKIISGDNELVAEHVCRAVGLEPGRIVSGTEIEAASDTALQAIADQNIVFARVSPSQKNRIIQAVRARGHVVGYMGDGVNDAPSLHAADVGISVASAVEIAKQSADIVLSRPDLLVLRDGILHGRRAFGNVMKYLLMGTSSNFGNMFSMAAATLFLPFLPMLPTQILLNNLLYDMSQITIPSDTVDASYIKKPRHWDIKLIRDFMIFIGPLSSIFDILTFWVLLNVFKAGAKEFHTGWFVESLCTQILVIFVIRTVGRPWTSRPSRALLVSILVCVAVGCLLPLTSLGTTLGFVPLPLAYYAFLGGATVVYLSLVEIVKQRVFAMHFE